MEKEEMIKAIYGKIADKTLSFGCKIKEKYKGELYEHTIIEIIENNKIVLYIRHTGGSITIKKGTFEIIGHPVMIGDILDYLEKEVLRISKINDEIEIGFSLNKWVEKRKPIEEQSLDCITYVYNLII